jgi:hypothetical protein
MAGWRLRFRAEEHGSHSPSHFFQASNVGVARWWQLAGDGLEGGGLAGGRVATWQQRWGGVWAAATWKVVAGRRRLAARDGRRRLAARNEME